MSMKVKGTALIARRQTVSAEFGEDAWEEFFEEFVQGAPDLAGGVLPITSIPVDTFLAFSDALVKRFYAGDDLERRPVWRAEETRRASAARGGSARRGDARASSRRDGPVMAALPPVNPGDFKPVGALVHWRFGEDSADWALTAGPYSNFRGTRDAAGFLTVAPALWRAYYSAGSFEAGMEDSGTHTWAHIESPARHLHFEYSVMGFVKRALQLVGARVHGHEAVRGFSRGDRDVYYRFEIG